MGSGKEGYLDKAERKSIISINTGRTGNENENIINPEPYEPKTVTRKKKNIGVIPLPDEEDMLKKAEEGLNKKENKDIILKVMKEIDDVSIGQNMNLDFLELDDEEEEEDDKDYVNRLKSEEGMEPFKVKKDPVAAREELAIIGKRVVKRGAFSRQALEAARHFMAKVNSWADNDRAVDFLYVDGKPIRQFVYAKYGYAEGGGNRAKEREMLGAYAAMICARQNHAITLVCPVVRNGVADVDIRNLDIISTSKKDSREKKVSEVRYRLLGEEYRKYCESAYRSSERARSGSLLRMEKNAGIAELDRMEYLNRALKEAGRGTHQNYDDFVYAFTRYFDALEIIGTDPAHMDVDQETLHFLGKLNSEAYKAANAYLKGKNMKLPRHVAVKNIREMLSTHASNYSAAKKSGKLKDKYATIPLKDILDRKEEGFEIIGIESEIKELKEKSSKSREVNDKNTYVTIDKDLKLEREQKIIMEMKHAILKDENARYAFNRLKKSENDSSISEDTRVLYARTFLQVASSAICKDAKYGPLVRKRYPEAGDDSDKLMSLVVRDQLSTAFENEFNLIPSLRVATDAWSEEVLSRDAIKLSYKSNSLGESISLKDFELCGGTCAHTYVTAKEAASIVKKSDGFLRAVKVKGHEGMMELRPALPEYATYSKGQPTEEKIPLRKTMNLMIKTFLYMTMDDEGHMKDQVDMYEGTAVSSMFDNMFHLEPGKNNSQRVTYNNMVVDLVMPAMEKMLTKEYIKKGMSKSKAEYKANEDAINACENFFKLVDMNFTNLIASYDCSLHDFRSTARFMRNMDRNAFLNDPKVKEIRIDGKAPSRQEIEEALDDFMAEIEEEEADLKKLRNMDSDSELTFNMSSCSDNAKFTETLRSSLCTSKQYPTYGYKPKDKIKENPLEVVEYMLEHKEQLFDAFGQSDENREIHTKRLLKYRDILKGKGKLNFAEEDDLKGLYDYYCKYDTHRGANICIEGGDTITVETFAATDDKLINAPYTTKAKIGRYRSEKKNMIDKDNNMVYHQGMKSYYDKDNYFSHCDSRRKVLKCNLKRIIRTMSGKLGNQEIQ